MIFINNIMTGINEIIIEYIKKIIEEFNGLYNRMLYRNIQLQVYTIIGIYNYRNIQLQEYTIIGIYIYKINGVFSIMLNINNFHYRDDIFL